jgi:hypothetical protein
MNRVLPPINNDKPQQLDRGAEADKAVKDGTIIKAANRFFCNGLGDTALFNTSKVKASCGTRQHYATDPQRGQQGSTAPENGRRHDLCSVLERGDCSNGIRFGQSIGASKEQSLDDV